MSLIEIQKSLRKLSNPEKAKFVARYFKTGKGEYGEGDIFLGLSVPESRKIAKKFSNLSIDEVSELLTSKIHEERFVALEILVFRFEKGDEKLREEIYKFYLKNKVYINNWDLVDTSAPYIVGEFLKNKDKSILIKLAKSKNLWEKRISIVSTYAFIKNNDLKTTFEISKILLSDSHDLIHKAIGWMLREAGKISQEELENFLKTNYFSLPRTTLRYAIERFPEEKRKKYLKGELK